MTILRRNFGAAIEPNVRPNIRMNLTLPESRIPVLFCRC